MSAKLEVQVAHHSEPGVKTGNDDACDVRVPDDTGLLTTKGVAAVIADGMSGSEGGRQAAESCVLGFLADYYSTPESWTAKTAGSRVLGALNRWLCGQGHSVYGSARGMVTTFSALVIKSSTAHLFHVGDTRVYRLRDDDLEQLTQDHRLWVSKEKNYLSRAMGADPHVDIDYRRLVVELADIYLFTTDGVHEFLSDSRLRRLLATREGDLYQAAKAITAEALENGSNDNVTCQLLRVTELGDESESDVYQRLTELPFPPELEPGMVLDGYRILREIHASKRSQVYLALDTQTGHQVVLKTPSANYQDDAEYIDRFLHEEWVGRRLTNPHLLKVLEPHARRSCLYLVTEYVEGQSLRQWMHDNPAPDLTQVREMVAQITDGLRAFQRMEMVHQDLKPENILIDRHGTLKLIDFGSAKIAGIDEISSVLDRNIADGTVDYTAPECALGFGCGHQADIFSLGVIAYELLTGKLPFGEHDKPQPINRMRYTSAREHNPVVPVWVDGALAKAVKPDPRNRYPALSEFVYDLIHPNSRFAAASLPLAERNPLGFWRGFALILLLTNLALLYLLSTT